MNTDVTAKDIGLQQNIEALKQLSQIRIAVISDAAPERNGVGTYYIDLIGHLKNRVAEIDIFCPTIENGQWKAGLVFPLPGDATQKLCFPNPIKMKRFIQNIKPDVVLIATPGVYGIVGAYLAHQLKIPAITGFHTSFKQLTDLYWKDSIAGKIVHGYFKVSHYYLFKKCQTVLANSEDMIEQARKLNPRNVKLISTVISPLFTNADTQPYDGKFKRILFAGRLAPEKNIDTIIKAAKALPQLHFSIAGDGPLMDTFQQSVKGLSNVSMLGWLNREALRDQIDQHDALILPSHFESFGTIVLEAMARKRLVIVSKGCGIADWPEYARGFYTMESDELLPTLNRITEQSNDERQAMASTAKQITQAINEKSLHAWYDVLLEHCRK
ncbi:Alpha-D-kanosaminyltransferase [Thalassocella blandensis]|nr:Alpha-D-kanosaminyltransferase [Thalassocella blandensis]